MPILGFLLLLVEIYLVIHAFRTGRERWAFVILLFPAIGCLAYFILEMWPELKESPKARNAQKEIENKFRPGGELQLLKDNLERTDTIANRMALADFYAEHGKLDQAIDLYEKSLTGTFENDTTILTGLCYACFYNKDNEKFTTYYNRLKKTQGDRLSRDIMLLSARMQEAVGNDEAAREEYQTLIKSYPGEEARYRYGILLKRLGDGSGAGSIFDEIVKEAGHAPKYYRKTQKKWIDAARNELNR